MSYITPEESLVSFLPTLPKELRNPELLVTTPLPPCKRCSTETHEQTNDIKQKILQSFPYISGGDYVKVIRQDSKEPSSPLRVGIMLSGGPAPGGHNVLTGLFDGLKKIHPDSVLLGFIEGGQGIIDQEYIVISSEFLHSYRNSGGFNIISTGRKSIVTEENKQKCLQTAKDLNLDGLVIVGGDGSNTATAILANYFASNGAKTTVVGVPKTIDGDLYGKFLELPFGFDSATKFYSNLIGNISRDALSCQAHYHFIKLMGRSASHIALECALQTHPNMVLIGEEIAAKNLSLKAIVSEICTVIAERASIGKYYGIILIPEGIIEFIPEIKLLVEEINSHPHSTNIEKKLSAKSQRLLQSFPKKVQDQLLHDRDAHGNVYVSKISVDSFLIYLVEKELRENFTNVPFNAVSHFLGYEGRCCLPSAFDNDYGYSLGIGASVLVKNKNNGYLSCIDNLTQPPEQRNFRGVPISSMLTFLQNASGETIPMIKKHLVDISSPAFLKLQLYRKIWSLEDSYRFPGPIQIQYPPETSSDTFCPFTLLINKLDDSYAVKKLTANHRCIEIPD
ncbi:diphosphate--fructose-6-phosphate 1-phosphotransferase [Chlamydiifrater phoenicopteri]|uniref:diphosphate--fructose-6-phosphate 1-phosphotransferase n=1 Tax=Chlamydiifrater phoenicopteri TaxID=2681469 RepID=UPI001BD14621|nr:diphosphate--fructose-6-phosphate 1-phosphotransferase [Chlamydiifrater phoenicopteri]